MRWPFVHRSYYDTAFALWSNERTENFTLRDALKSANEEIRRLRSCVAELSGRASAHLEKRGGGQ